MAPTCKWPRSFKPAPTLKLVVFFLNSHTSSNQRSPTLNPNWGPTATYAPTRLLNPTVHLRLIGISMLFFVEVPFSESTPNWLYNTEPSIPNPKSGNVLSLLTIFSERCSLETFKPAFTPNFIWACAGMASARQAITISVDNNFFISCFV